MRLRFPPKTPYEELTYFLDFSDWVNEGATLASAAWSFTPAGLTVVTSAVDGVTGRAHVKLSGGTAGTDYAWSCKAAASDGELPERTGRIKVNSSKPE